MKRARTLIEPVKLCKWCHRKPRAIASYCSPHCHTKGREAYKRYLLARNIAANKRCQNCDVPVSYRNKGYCSVCTITLNRLKRWL